MAELAPALMASASSKVASVRECGEEAMSLVAEAAVREVVGGQEEEEKDKGTH